MQKLATRRGLVSFSDQARQLPVLRLAFGHWRRAASVLTDRWLGIQTESVDVPQAATELTDAHWYVPLAYGQARRVLRSLRLENDDVVYDIGCGFGRVVCLAAQHRVREVIGVECDARFGLAADANVRGLRRLASPVRIEVSDAAVANYDGATVVILFNPFGAATMRAVLKRLEAGRAEQSASVRIAYINPTAEAEFERCGWLTCTNRTRSLRFRHTTSYWESKPSPAHVSPLNWAGD